MAQLVLSDMRGVRSVFHGALDVYGFGVGREKISGSRITDDVWNTGIRKKNKMAAEIRPLSMR